MADLDDAQTTSTTRTLEFSDIDPKALGDLGNLDISFDASPSDSGKIRVRIHPSSSGSSRAGSPGTSSASMKPEISSSSLGMWAGPDPDSNYQSSFSSETYGSSASPYAASSGGDPFLGIGASTDYGMTYSSGASSAMYNQMDLSSSADYGQSSDPNFPYGSEFSVGDNSTGGKRRVRIALKSMPAAGGEGGEWEVQFC